MEPPEDTGERSRNADLIAFFLLVVLVMLNAVAWRHHADYLREVRQIRSETDRIRESTQSQEDEVWHETYHDLNVPHTHKAN